MSDYGIKMLADKAPVRTVAIDTTETVAEAVQRHGTRPTASAALGRLITAAALFGATMKDEKRVTLRLLGDGPLGTLIADALPNGEVRGYVQNPQVDLPLNEAGKLNVGEAVGKNGLFAVARDYGSGSPYIGSSPLISGEVGEDVANYFVHSEQIPSVVSLGVLVAPDGGIRAAGGILVQAMPGCGPEVLEQLEKNSHLLSNISWQIDKGATPAELASAALRELEPQVTTRFGVQFSCHCSKERIQAILLGLGDQDLDEMIQSEEPAEVRCHFCNKTYLFGKEELLAMRQG